MFNFEIFRFDRFRGSHSREVPDSRHLPDSRQLPAIYRRGARHLPERCPAICRDFPEVVAMCPAMWPSFARRWPFWCSLNISSLISRCSGAVVERQTVMGVNDTLYYSPRGY